MDPLPAVGPICSVNPAGCMGWNTDVDDLVAHLLQMTPAEMSALAEQLAGQQGSDLYCYEILDDDDIEDQHPTILDDPDAHFFYFPSEEPNDITDAFEAEETHCPTT